MSGTSTPSRHDLFKSSDNLPADSELAARRMSSSTTDLEILGDVLEPKQTSHRNVSIRERVHHFTWTWFTTVMSTSGIALVISQTPHRFHGLTVIGDIFFILSILLFVLFTAAITTRFILFPKAFISSLSHPTESLFFPAFWISIVSILSGMTVYGIPKTGQWFVVTMRVLFWVYTASTFVVAVGQYFFLFTGKPFTLQSFTPAWILPIFPIMLCGTLASLLGPSQPPEFSLPMLMAGITFQGLGILVSMLFYSIYLGGLMTNGLPTPNTRPGMFVAVGPPSFTAIAILGISSALKNIYPTYTSITDINHPEMIADIFRIVAVSAAVFLWGTSFWFFSIAFVSVIHGACTGKPGMSFHLVWWSFIFPNTGFTMATIDIGKVLMSEGVQWVGSVMTVMLVAAWIFVAGAHIRAVSQKNILWPGKDEDRDQKEQ